MTPALRRLGEEDWEPSDSLDYTEGCVSKKKQSGGGCHTT